MSGSGFGSRVKKLRETLVAVQQLDKNMSSLRSWLAHIETELSRPIVYDTCDDQEIQRKLSQQQASWTAHEDARTASDQCEKKTSPAHSLFRSVHLSHIPAGVYTLRQTNHTHRHTSRNVSGECVCFSVNAKLYHICVTHSELVEKDADHTRKSQHDSDIRCWLFF